MDYIRELFAQVFSSLLRNKLRSFLTMAGIAWGVASMVLIVAMGDGFKLGQRNNTKQLGENIVIVFPGRTEKQVGGQRAGRRIRLEYSDVLDIRQECYQVARVMAELSNQTRAASPFNSGAFRTMGVEPIYSEIRTIPIETGRFLTAEDDREVRRVCILGDNVRKQLFGDRIDLLGSEIALNGNPFRIVGLMPHNEQNKSYNGLDTDKIFVPYSTMVRDLPPKDSTYHRGIVNDLVYVPRNLEAFDEASRQVKRVLARNHGYDPDDTGGVYIWDTVKDAQLVDNIFISMTAFLGTVALVTLTLGGVGVMNIMLVTVTERTREIGLRMALGATRRRILLDFLIEGMVLAILSGSVGFGGAYGLAAIVNSFPLPEMFAGLPVKSSTAVFSFAALGVIAVVSALVPAWRASALTPVEALRYER